VSSKAYDDNNFLLFCYFYRPSLDKFPYFVIILYSFLVSLVLGSFRLEIFVFNFFFPNFLFPSYNNVHPGVKLKKSQTGGGGF